MKFAVLLATLCYARVVSGEIHSWKAFYTGTSGLTDFPEFVAINVLDDEVMGYFDSRTNRFESKQSWMAETLGQQYEEQETNILRGHVPTFSNNIRIVRDRFNQSEGVHTFQLMYGCQWDDETQSTDGFEQFGYDGEDFVTLDLKNKRYIATTPQSLITKHKWDNEAGRFEHQKQYFTQICIEWLKKYVQYGSSTLGRKVVPEVSLLQKGPEVVCHATGFYPEGVMITWKKDGEEMQDDVDVGETLPNEDGTFQKRAVLTVSPEERKTGEYACEVAHKSGKTIVVNLPKDDDKLDMGMVFGIIFAAVVVIGGIVGVFMMVKKKKDYEKASQADTNSDNSNPIARNEDEKLAPSV